MFGAAVKFLSNNFSSQAIVSSQYQAVNVKLSLETSHLGYFRTIDEVHTMVDSEIVRRRSMGRRDLADLLDKTIC